MNITINGRTIKPIAFSPFEEAWNIEDVLHLLEYYRLNQVVVLGGDIIDMRFKHTYDSWYYELNVSKDLISNSNESVEKAIKYIKQYIKNNGNNYYVVVVVERNKNNMG